MKKFVNILAAAVLCASCGQQGPADPFKTALESEIKSKIGEGSRISFEVFERVDSTTFGEELTYRREVFDIRRSQNEKFFKKYKSAGLVESAAAKRRAITHDDEVIAGLAQMNESLSGILGDIAYYDYHFTCRVSSGSARSEFRDYYATITPNLEVMSIESSKKKLHRNLGRVIPGYLELVRSNDSSDNQ